MSDPFAVFMAHWIPTMGAEAAFNSWLEKQEKHGTAYVIPDLEPFKDTSGKVITGRRAWREHLKETGTIEFGHTDLRHATEAWTAKKTAGQTRLNAASKMAPAVDPGNARPVEPSDVSRRVMARLHGRPQPSRTELIKIAMEESKR